MSRLPLPVKSSLAPNPSMKPRYAVSVPRTGGVPLEVADPQMVRVLIALMDMQAVMGGAASHWGGPSAMAEINSALHGLVFERAQTAGQTWFDLFSLVNDAGHCENALYALKALYGFADLTIEDLKGFRSIQSPLTGHGESHLFPKGVLLSNGPLGSAIPQSQGLCMADRLAGLQRVTVTTISDGACMEGEAKESLAAIPGLAKAGKMNPYVLIISDNNTKLTGRIDKDAFSMEPTFASLKELGWEVLTLEKAHDLRACVETLAKAIQQASAQPQKPVAIHARTVKGYGVKKTADSATGGHGFPLSDARELRSFIKEFWADKELPAECEGWLKNLEDTAHQKAAAAEGKPKEASASEKVQNGVSKILVEKRKEGLPIVSVSSDLPGSTGVAGFQKAYPEFTFDVGVAEANMVSVAAGFSKLGYIPVVDTFSQFGVTKGGLPFTMAALSEAPVIAIFSHAGFQDAADGASHQALSYFAQMGSIPHTDVYALTTSEEAEVLVGQALEEFVSLRKKGAVPRSKIFFLGRENFPRSLFKQPPNYKLGKAQVVFEETVPQKTVTIVAAGPLVHEAVAAAQKLSAEGVGVIVVNPSIINHPDVPTIMECVQRSEGKLVTVEDHQLVGGMGAQLSHALLRAGGRLHLKSLGVNDTFGQSAYKASELYEKHGLDAESIRRAVKELL